MTASQIPSWSSISPSSRLLRGGIRWLEQRSEKADYSGQALQLLAEEFPNGEHENRETCESMLAHAQAVLRYQSTSEDDMRHRAALLYNVGWFNWRQGGYVSAYEAVSESYNIYQERTGDVATTTFSMTFFNFSPGNEAHPEAWVVSEKIWIYWAISLPLTIITILSWLTWQRRFSRT